MSMRTLWAILFVVAPLAAVAGYGSTYGVTSMGGSGGGTTEGAAISGGTASRLLFSDGSTQVSTATPALGAALTLSGALSGTSSNFTGQMVFDGVTTDISTGTNQDLTVDPNGTGIVALNSDVTMTDDAMKLTLTSTTASDMTLTVASTTRMQVGANTASAWVRSLVSSAPVTIYNDNNVASGSDVLVVGDGNNAPTSVTRLLVVDGAGTLHLPASTTIPAGDCDADAEVGRLRRYAKDASNITLCACQKVGGAFGWAAVPTGGDCT